MTPPAMRAIDLNCDLGEGGAGDAELMPLVTSANIACGAHAGDAATMHATVALAQQHGVAVGAHPGFADREHFGRRELRLPPDEIRELVRGQIEALRALAPLRHVKPHGALYNLAARDAEVARAIAKTVRDTDAALAPRGTPGALLGVDAAVAQVLRFIATGKVRATDGTDLAIEAETVCVHGDSLHAQELARALRAALTAAGVVIRAL